MLFYCGTQSAVAYTYTYGYDVTCDQVQIFCDASAQQTKETCKDTNKDFASHFNKVKNEIMNFCDNSIKLDISLHFDQLFPL